jgi:hypothetical protein
MVAKPAVHVIISSKGFIFYHNHAEGASNPKGDARTRGSAAGEDSFHRSLTAAISKIFQFFRPVIAIRTAVPILHLVKSRQTLVSIKVMEAANDNTLCFSNDLIAELDGSSRRQIRGLRGERCFI